jgi:1,4-dihydroxy-6-naphthoate synthase
VKIADLGEEWELQTKCPIPLGGIVIHRKYSSEIQQKVDRVLKRSVEFALDNPDSGRDFVKCYAQELEEEVIKMHIELYVNSFTVDLGEAGRNSVFRLFERAINLGITENLPVDIFVD